MSEQAGTRREQAGAREAVLTAIRLAIGGAAGTAGPAAAAGPAAEWAAIPRGYESTRTLDDAELLGLLKHRLEDYDAGVYRAGSSVVANAIAQILHGRGKQRLAVSSGFEQGWLPEGFVYLRDDGLSAAELDVVDGAITACAVAIAETGTLVLQGAGAASPNATPGLNGQGRRILTLVPDYHLCVVRVEQVVQTVPEAFARLAAEPTLPVTFISGPSATADIEMTRIKGVHGPRFLDVLLLE